MHTTTHVPLPQLLAALVPAMVLVPVSSDMASLMLPTIATEFTASIPQVAWVVTAFLLASAIGIPVHGRLADRFSLRRLFVIALSIFAIGNVIAALSPDLVTLVAGRALSGAGGAAIPVLSIVSAARVLTRERAALTVGFIAAAGGLGTALGPAIGGGLGQSLGWRALFWLLAGWALALIPAVARLIPHTRPATTRRLDLPGGVLLGASAGLLLLGVTQAAGVDGFAAPSSWGLLLAGAVAASLFALRTRTADDPFVPPSLFVHRGYTAAVAVIFLAMMVNLTTLVLVPMLLVEAGGLTPGQGALVMIPGGLALAATSPLAGRLSARGVNEGTISVAGLGTVAIAMLLLSSIADGGAPVLAGVGTLALGAGFALVVTSTTSVINQILPKGQVGTGVGIFQGAQFLGAGAGPAVFGVLLSARRASGAEAINPLHSTDASGHSDIFLALAIVTMLAMVAALRVRAARRAHRPPAPPAPPLQQRCRNQDPATAR